jgi:hypothetical protein
VKHLLLAALVVSAVACGNRSTPPTEPEPTGTPVAPAPSTGEECEAAGYTVVGDIGDGQVRCPEGMEEVSRIQHGIEGGVCCKPAG